MSGLELVAPQIAIAILVFRVIFWGNEKSNNNIG
jgi:hypothetical protein